MSLAVVDAHVDRATADMVVFFVLSASPNWTSSVHIRGCSIVCRQDDGAVVDSDLDSAR